jgi:hypothetical protein
MKALLEIQATLSIHKYKQLLSIDKKAWFTWIFVKLVSGYTYFLKKIKINLIILFVLS